jgi:C-terminal processing protease CtpA/Prc
VLQLVEGGPAQKCGKIAEGDIISEVDSVAMLGKGLPELLKALAGPPGSIAKLSFMRFVGAEITPYTVSIVREVVRLELSRVGCGVTVRAAPSGFMEISGVEPRVLSSADVRVGDVVLAVDGTVTSDAQALLGPPGTDCRLTLQRGEGAQAARQAFLSYFSRFPTSCFVNDGMQVRCCSQAWRCCCRRRRVCAHRVQARI